MANPLIPDSHANRLQFLQNFKAKVADLLAAGKIDAATAARYNDILDPLITDYGALVTIEAAVPPANAKAAQTFTQQHDPLFAMINEVKNNTAIDAGTKSAMQIAVTSTTRDPSKTKPKIKVKAEPGHVTVTGSKDYAELVNIYMRVLGTTEWILVGARRKKLPFDDQTPLKTAGVAEVREYAARSVTNDEEVGDMSDIVQVTFAG